MARTLLNYTTENNLANRLEVLQGKRIAEKGGAKVNLAEVEKEVADFCGVGVDTIGMIKRGANQPSLPLAMKLAQFFNCTVEDIFTYKDIVCQNCGTLWDGKQTFQKTKTIVRPMCQECGSVID